MPVSGNNMLTVSLEEMKFYAGHGVYAEEDMVGNEFVADVFVTIDIPEKTDRLDQTVDYERLYDIVRGAMERPAGLLETIALACVTGIKEAFPAARTIEIKISKLHPPIGGEIGRSKIKVIKHFD